MYRTRSIARRRTARLIAGVAVLCLASLPATAQVRLTPIEREGIVPLEGSTACAPAPAKKKKSGLGGLLRTAQGAGLGTISRRAGQVTGAAASLGDLASRASRLQSSTGC